MVIIVGLAIWRSRFYCVAICPVGTILGLFAKFGLYGMQCTDACTGCRACERQCPTGCIDSRNRSVDRERCVLCLNCLSACPRNGVRYMRTTLSSVSTHDVVDVERRQFLVKGGVAAAVIVGSGVGLGGYIRQAANACESIDGLIFPPGAGDANRFARQCTSCLVCVAKCPAKIIKPSPFLFGPVRLDYSASGCNYDCTLCNEACPSGALTQLTLEDKQWSKIGEAKVEPSRCRIVTENAPCTLCVDACPKGAIFMMDGPNGLKVPRVAAFHCIGCGACQAVCPAKPKAVVVYAVG